MFSSCGKQFEPEKDIPDLSGKVILITGGKLPSSIDTHPPLTHPGNTGLGKETVLQLAKHNPAEIFLAARTASKADAAIAEIKQAVPTASITHLPLDLTSFASIAAAADTFKARSSRLDILINNAGVMATPWELTKEGYELQFGTNHVGHQLLTRLLLPTMLKTAEADPARADIRVVNVSSMGHRLAPAQGILFDTAALEACSTWQRYGQSKLANVLFTRELARRYPGVKAAAVHPGVILTDLYSPSSQSLFYKYAYKAIGPLVGISLEQGAKTQLWAATARELVSGEYYVPTATLDKGSKLSQDEKLAAQLYDWTEEQFKKHGY